MGVPQDLGALLAPVAAGKYPWLAGSLRLSVPSGAECLPCEALTDPAVLGAVIDRFGARFGGADRRAVVSLWTACYFSLLGIGSAIAWLELRRVLPLALHEAGICLDRDSGAPLAFCLRDLGGVAPEAGLHAAMAPPLRHHAEPLIATIARAERLSQKVIWGNAAGYLDWIVEEAGRLTDPALAVEGRVLLDAPAWPDGWRNPMHGALRPLCEGGARVMRRRVCCLRHALPGVGGCGATCPLPEGRLAPAPATG